MNRPYFFFGLSGACVKAEPAKVLATLEAFGLLKVLPAILATRGLVFSFFAMRFIPLKRAEVRVSSISRPDSFGAASAQQRITETEGTTA